MNTHIHSCAFAYTVTHTFLYVCTHALLNTHTHTLTHTLTSLSKTKHACVFPQTFTRLHVHAHINLQTNRST